MGPDIMLSKMSGLQELDLPKECDDDEHSGTSTVCLTHSLVLPAEVESTDQSLPLLPCRAGPYVRCVKSVSTSVSQTSVSLEHETCSVLFCGACGELCKESPAVAKDFLESLHGVADLHTSSGDTGGL